MICNSCILCAYVTLSVRFVQPIFIVYVRLKRQGRVRRLTHKHKIIFLQYLLCWRWSNLTQTVWTYCTLHAALIGYEYVHCVRPSNRRPHYAPTFNSKTEHFVTLQRSNFQERLYSCEERSEAAPSSGRDWGRITPRPLTRKQNTLWPYNVQTFRRGYTHVRSAVKRRHLVAGTVLVR